MSDSEPTDASSEEPDSAPGQSSTGKGQAQSQSSRFFSGTDGSSWSFPSLGISKLMKTDELNDTKELLRMIEAEFWGTFFLVFFGVSSCMIWSGAPAPGLVSISLCFGIAVATLAQIFGHISGAHLNPAVSFGLVASGDCGMAKALCFLLAQNIGSFLGAFGASMMLHPNMKLNAMGITGSLSKLNGIPQWQGVIMESVITAPLIFIICAVSDKDRRDVQGSAPLAIGLAITLGHIAGIPATGASMNPARSMGPLMAAIIGTKDVSPSAKQAIVLAVQDLWVYFAGPILGGVFAGALYRCRFAQKNQRQQTQFQDDDY